MPTPLLLLAAVVAGWVVQLYLSYQQQMAFMDAVKKLRRSGTVCVGSGGKRYRGGRAYVALAFDDRGVVRDALSLQGFSTFARGKPLPAVIGLKVNQLAGDRVVPGASRQQREAARHAAVLLKQGASPAQATPPAGGQALTG
ncbi:MAG: transcriptional regulator GutM [Nocardioides sp.]